MEISLTFREKGGERGEDHHGDSQEKEKKKEKGKEEEEGAVILLCVICRKLGHFSKLNFSFK